MTSPAASTPRANGGTRPTSQPPVRTNSSQFPTPAALTSISTWPVAHGGGSGSSASPTPSPHPSVPAALKLMPGSGRDRRWSKRADDVQPRIEQAERVGDAGQDQG